MKRPVYDDRQTRGKVLRGRREESFRRPICSIAESVRSRRLLLTHWIECVAEVIVQDPDSPVSLASALCKLSSTLFRSRQSSGAADRARR